MTDPKMTEKQSMKLEELTVQRINIVDTAGNVCGRVVRTIP